MKNKISEIIILNHESSVTMSLKDPFIKKIEFEFRFFGLLTGLTIFMTQIIVGIMIFLTTNSFEKLMALSDLFSCYICSK